VSHRDFANIAVGDTVIINSSRGRTLAHVAKVTKTQITVANIRFMRSDGGEYGGDQWHRKWVTIPNAADIAAVQAEQRQERAVSEAFRLRKQIETALSMITSRRAQGWGPTIEASNDHLRRALEALQTKQEELL
jgi:hypothetical protein